MKAMSRRTPETRGPSRCQAFTMIELMMAVAIIGILAAIAIPGYEVFIARAKAAEIVIKVEEMRTRFGEAKASGQLAAKCSLGGVIDPALLVSPYATLGFGAAGGTSTVILVVSSRAGQFGTRGVEVARQAHHVLDRAGLVQPGARVFRASVIFAVTLVDEPACKTLSIS